MEDKTCKICYDENEEASNPLISPCLCAGSLRHVHRDCLQQWIKTAALERCDLCKQPFDVEFKLKPPKTKAASDRELLLALLLMLSLNDSERALLTLNVFNDATTLYLNLRPLQMLYYK